VSCFKLRMPESAIALWAQELGEGWADVNDRLILKLLGSSAVGLDPMLWTNDNRPVRKVDGAPQSGRISKCAHPRPIHLRSSHASLPCITLLQESRLVRLQRRHSSSLRHTHIEDQPLARRSLVRAASRLVLRFTVSHDRSIPWNVR